MPNVAPQMFQLPSPNVPYQGGLSQGLAQGFQSGMQNQQAQQALNMAKQQQTISQVDTLLKNGISYPGLLKSFWPAIATRMNSLSPDYQLDPNNPPDNILSFSKSLSDISDGVQAGAVNMMQAHAATKQLIQDSIPPNAASVLGNPSQPGNSGQQIPQSGQGQSPSMPSQPQPQQPQGMQAGNTGAQPMAPQPQQQDPLQNFASIKSQYDKANQLIAQAPLEGPQSQEVLRKQLESSSLGLNYKKALDQLATTANQQYSEGQQNQRNEFNQNQESIRSLQSKFDSDSQDAQNVFTNFNVFNSQMAVSKQFEGAKNTTAAVNSEKASIMALSQMIYPSARRGANPDTLEDIEKSGPLPTLVTQSFNRLNQGDIMTPKQITGLRQLALSLATAREKYQTDVENSAAQAIQLHGGNPRGALMNYRPSSMVSTSSLFPNQASTPNKPLIGEVRKGYQYLGGEPSSADNWTQASNE